MSPLHRGRFVLFRYHDFGPDFFQERRAPAVAHILTGDGEVEDRVAGRWSILQKPELISAGRTVGSSLSASRECDTEVQDPPPRFFRCSLLSLHLSISDHKTSFVFSRSGYRFRDRAPAPPPLPTPVIESRDENWTRGAALSIKRDEWLAGDFPVTFRRHFTYRTL